MKRIFADSEAHYSSEFSLRNMTPIEYILDERFESHMWTVVEDDAPDVQVFVGDDIQQYLRGQKERYMLVTHNALYDAMVLALRYNIHPDMLICTMGMTRALLRHKIPNGRVSLEVVADHLQLGRKSGFLPMVKDKRLAEIQANGMWLPYVAYGMQDTLLCRGIYNNLKSKFPASEHVIMDMVIKMATQPQFVCDQEKLYRHLAQIQADKATLLERCGLDKDTLLSNDKFAQALARLGVDPPTKVSPITGKTAWALAKTDKGLTDLAESDDEDVAALVAARLGIKSTLEETRTQRLISISGVTEAAFGVPLLPVPLRYAGAHTHRLSGDYKINLQNLPSRKSTALREAFMAEPMHTVLAVDASQIEARLTAWLSGQWDLVEEFRNGDDIYSNFASDIYGRRITRADKLERLLGKICLAEGTMVYTDSGLKPIETVTLENKLWDGAEWVSHDGLLVNGYAETLNLSGLRLTPDHLVLCGTEWKEARLLAQDEHIHSLALATAAASSPSRDILGVSEAALSRSRLSVRAVLENIVSTITRLGTSKPPDARTAEGAQGVRNGTGYTPTPCPTTKTVDGSLTGFRRLLAAATMRLTKPMRTTGCAAYQSGSGGRRTGPNFYGMFRPFQGGIIQTLKWIASRLTGTTSRVISGLLPRVRTSKINDVSQTLRKDFGLPTQRLPVFDLANAGPRNQFMVRTDVGPLLVHNCILALGFGMGHVKFRETVRIQALANGYDIQITDAEAQRIVGLYRRKYQSIKLTWDWLNAAISRIYSGQCGGEMFGPCSLHRGQINLPSGLSLFYEDLRCIDGQWSFFYGGERKRLYGGKLLENIVQALDRVYVFEAAAMIRRMTWAATGYEPVLAHQIHDELVYVVPDEHLHTLKSIAMECMSTPRKWCLTLPLAAEAKMGPSYGELHGV